MNRQPSAPGRPTMHRLRVALIRTAAIAGLVVATFGVATAASAHDLLESTNPADKSTVATLPDEVTLTFNQPALALGSVLQVVGPSGNVAEGPPKLVDRTVQQAVQPGSPAGAYTVQWRVTSLDGHPISGQFSFTATAGNAGTAPAGATGSASSVAGSSTQALPADSGSSGGSSTPIIVLLVVAGLLVVVAGLFLALHRPAETPDDDELPTVPDTATRSEASDSPGITGSPADPV